MERAIIGGGGYVMTDAIKHATRIILTLFPSLWIGFGIPGNILIVVVLRKDGIKDNFLSIYMSSMAFFNILIILVGVFRQSIKGLTGWDYFNSDADVCFISYWFLFYSTSAVNWTQVLVTGARAFFLWRPMRALVIFNKTFALSTLCFLHIPLALVTWVLSLDRVVPQYYQSSDGESRKMKLCYLTRGTVEAFLQNLLFAYGPACGLLLFNSFIRCTLLNKHQKRPSIYKSGMSVESPVENHDDVDNRNLSNLSTLSVISDILFLLTIMPSALYLSFVDEMHDYESGLQSDLAGLYYAICISFLYANYSLSCLIYCVLGQKFRQALLDLLFDQPERNRVDMPAKITFRKSIMEFV